MRIAQFTDLHARWHLPGTCRLAKRRSRNMRALFERGLREAAAAQPDLIAVTGDLLDLPDYLLSGDDYYDYQPAQWQAEAEADYRLFRELLEATGIPWLALPGNHDWPRLMAPILGPANTVRDLAGCRVATFWDRDTYDHVPRRFDRERELFLRLLSDDCGLPQVHLQHYLVWPPLNDGWPYSYWEAEELRGKIVASEKVVCCLAGHRHSGWPPVREGRCTFTCAPAFGEFPHPWQLVTINGDEVDTEIRELLRQPLEADRPAVFLDRDGVLCREPSYHSGPEGVIAIPGAGAALRRLREAGFALVVISSQSAVGQGYLSPARVDAGFDALARQLAADGGSWDAHYFSTGAGERAVHPDLVDNPHGKPKPDYIYQAHELLRVDLSRSWFVGDHLSDLQAGAAAGLRNLLVRTGHGARVEPELNRHPELAARVADDLAAAAELILAAGS